MKYQGKIQDPLDLVTKQYVDNRSGVKSVNGETGDVNLTIPPAYTLPVASSSVLGGIKSDGSLTVSSDGSVQVGFYNKGLKNDVDKLAMGCIDEFGHNKLAFLGAEYISVEYSNDAGSTWTDYGATDAQKIAAVTTSGGGGFVVGKKSANNVTVNDQVRMTIQAAQSGANRIYTRADHLLINISTQGALGCKAKIETLTIGNVINNTDNWVTLGVYDVLGWSGWNSIPCAITFGGSSTQTGQIGKIRITLTLDSLTSGNTLSLIDVRLIGHTNWTMPSELARVGRLYTIDTSQNATFPAKVTANWGFSGDLTGNASSATTASKLSTSSAGSANQPVYFSNGVPVAGNQIPTTVTFTLTGTTVTSTKTPSELATNFKAGSGVSAILNTTSTGDYESLYKITCNNTTIAFATITGNTLGGGFIYKRVVGNISTGVWTYEDTIEQLPTLQGGSY